MEDTRPLNCYVGVNITPEEQTLCECTLQSARRGDGYEEFTTFTFRDEAHFCIIYQTPTGRQISVLGKKQDSQTVERTFLS